MVLRFFYVLITLGLSLLCLPRALAQNALGLTLGGPSFINFTHALSDRKSVEAGVSFSYDDATHLYGDYLIQTKNIFKDSQLNNVDLFYGVGGLLVITNKDRKDDDGYYGKDSGSIGLGVRLPIGLEWRPPKLKEFGFNVELIPVVAIVPKTSLEFMAGIGFRYYF